MPAFHVSAVATSIDLFEKQQPCVMKLPLQGTLCGQGGPKAVPLQIPPLWPTSDSRALADGRVPSKERAFVAVPLETA